ncbi:Lactoylglutathione lyase [Clostridiales bacterium CHKCI001]|nr:Lactoylglutathione lyase [Clostridiales bacterium CHKCI001]
MAFKMVHENYNVYDLKRSIKFYEDALNMHETRRIEAEDGSFIIVYMGTGIDNFELELTWMRDMERPYNLGDCEFHLAFEAEDFEAAHEKHKAMGCICFENEAMGIYFIQDPDGYWLEVVPKKENK